MGTVHPFPGSTSQAGGQVGFERAELSRIVDLYGRMVAAGLWKDYAIQFGKEAATFWAFRRTAEHPEIKIEKRPALRHKQGMWALIGEDGRVLRRGPELGPVLAPVERRLMKAVNG
jgi:serine/threonine-protein kinase RIO1